MEGIRRARCSLKGWIRQCAAAVLFLAILLLPAPSAAHPPTEITLSYDRTGHMLTVLITHETPLPEAHYIVKVEIKKNDTIVSTSLYESQPDPKTFSYTYPVDANTDSVVVVTATCNISGEKTVMLDMRKIPR